MDIAQLALFVDVYRAGAFAPVARTRGLAPSSISRAIAAIEEEIGTLLFQRTTRALTPTDAGEAFYLRIAPLAEEFEAALDETRDRASRPSGRLRLTASASFGQIVLAPRLKAFRALYSDLAIDLVLSDDVVDLVAERIDLAIRHGSLSDSSLIATKLSDVCYRLVASPDYLSGAPKLSVPCDLAHHATIAFAYQNFCTQWTFTRAGKTESVSIAPQITLSNAAALRECARQGLGLALLADWTVMPDIESGRLVEPLADWSASGADQGSAIWLIWPSRRFVPAKVRAFVDWLMLETQADKGRNGQHARALINRAASGCHSR